MAVIRGTFLLQQHIQSNGPAFPGGIKHSLSFVPVLDKSIPQPQRFNLGAPNGSLSFDVDNPSVIAAVTPHVGKRFSITITSPPGT